VAGTVNPMSRVKHIDYPSAQHFRAQAASIRMLAVAITSPALLTRASRRNSEK
jgi:hypothetical protein